MELLVVVVVLCGILFASSGWLMTMIVITKQKHVRMIETFGHFSSIRTAGLSFKLPWPFQSASEDFSMQLMPLSENVQVKSKDNAFVTVPIHVQYQVNPDGAEAAFYSLENPSSQIRSYVVNQVRATASSKSFDDLFKARDTFKDDIESMLSVKMAEFGFKIVDVLVDDPQPSEDLREAFDRVLASTRLKEAASNEGEAAKILSVAKANAEGEALKIRGNAFKDFRKTIAEGFGEALDELAGKTGLSKESLLTFLLDINEKEALTNAAQSGGKIVYVTGSAQRGAPDPAALALLADNEPATPAVVAPKKKSAPKSND